MWKTLILTAATAAAARAAVDYGASPDFVIEPQDASVEAGSTVELDCELVERDTEDICAWKISGTHLGEDHFYNIHPPSKVKALFPDHNRVCSILIEDIDWRHDGLWTCWPLADDSHISSRAANVSVHSSGPTTIPPTPAPSTITPPVPSTTPAPGPPTTTPAPGPPTTTPAPGPPTTTPAPGPGFKCPSPNGLFADPHNPRYFYYCQDNIAIHLQCEHGMWDESSKSCH